MSDSDRILATYDVRSTPEEVAGLARRIAYEQTVELPPAGPGDGSGGVRAGARAGGDHLVPWTPAGEGIPRPGRPAPPIGSPSAIRGSSRTASFRSFSTFSTATCRSIRGVALADFSLPPAVAAEFAGPRFGVEGLRRLTGVHGRPLLATALKPRGLPVAEYARIAGEFALGGGDLVKDDQNLVTDFAGFRERVLRCRDAVEGANVRSGRRCLYFPLVSAPLESIDLHFDLVQAAGLRGVLLCPAVLGLDTVRALAAPARARAHGPSEPRGRARPRDEPAAAVRDPLPARRGRHLGVSGRPGAFRLRRGHLRRDPRASRRPPGRAGSGVAVSRRRPSVRRARGRLRRVRPGHRAARRRRPAGPRAAGRGRDPGVRGGHRGMLPGAPYRARGSGGAPCRPRVPALSAGVRVGRAGERSLPDGGGRFGPRSVPGGPPGRARRPLRRADRE